MATTETLSDINVRPMMAIDIEAIATIENSVYFAPWPKMAFSSILGLYPAFVVEKNNQIVGYTIFSEVLDEVHILNFVIAPVFQHQGLGRFLLKFLLQILIPKKVRRVSLEVAINNLSAISLYESCGFKRQGVRKEYYQTVDGRVDALILVYKTGYN